MEGGWVVQVWIDSDMGFDDLAAVLTVVHQPGVDVLGLSLVAGNAPLAVVTGNALRAGALFKWRFPIHAGRGKPLLGPLITAQDVLGPSGLASVGRPLPTERAQLDPSPAVDALARAIECAPEPLTLLALGPLTNLAVLLLWRPELAARLGRVVWMGGSASRGNHTAAAEFNAAVDPEALKVVLEAGVAFRVVGLDCCRQVTVSLADAEKLRALGTERARILADLFEAYARIPDGHGRRPMNLYDPLAAVALLDPAAVRFVPACIDVECGGRIARGLTTVETRVPTKAEANARGRRCRRSGPGPHPRSPCARASLRVNGHRRAWAWGGGKLG